MIVSCKEYTACQTRPHVESFSDIRNKISKTNTKINSVLMKLSVLLSFFDCSPIYGDSRLDLYVRHHKQRKTFNLTTKNLTDGMKPVQRKLQSLKRICSVKTCVKCRRLLQSKQTKLRNSCNILVRMPTCCPHPVFLPNGF